MKKKIINYIFNAAAGTIVLTDYETINLDGLLLITNVTDNILMYNFADSSNHASVSGNIISLSYNTTAMSDTDEIQIFYDDGTGYPLTSSELREEPVLIEVASILKQLMMAIRHPIALDRALNRLRATAVIESGSITLSGTNTVATVTNMSNVDNYQGKVLVIGQNITAWSTTVRSRIS